MHPLRATTLISLLLMMMMMMMIDPLWANDTAYWQCTAYDQDNQQWSSKHEYERMAINQALAACKNESHKPSACTVAHEACEFFVHGVSTRPSWQCTALDKDAKPWASNPYPQRDDAAIAAKAYCKERSASPDSCYVYLLTCINLNLAH